MESSLTRSGQFVEPGHPMSVSRAEQIITLSERTVKPRLDEVVEIAGDHLNAGRFLAEHGHVIRYSPELGRYLVWNRSWWQEDRLEGTLALANVTIDGLRAWVGEARDNDDFKRRSKHYNDSTRSGRREGMLAIARPSLTVSVDQLDRHPHLLACLNGTVDLRTGELLVSDPAQFLTRGIDMDYDPEATADEWDKFLRTIFADDSSLIAYVQRLLGYAITGEVGEHLLPIFYGTGANGKSQLLIAIRRILCEHAAAAPEGLLTESKHEQHPERLAMLRGRRLIVSSELEHRAMLAEGLVKSLTGGEPISARYMYGQRFEFEPCHTIVLVTNHMPKVRGTDEAIWRRLRMVPFSVTIPPDERVIDYGQILAERYGPAILSWLVKGAVNWYQEGLGESEQVKKATSSYRQREDTFAQFLEEQTTEIRGRTKVKVLQSLWKSWANEAGVAVGRTQDFTEWLESHGAEIETYQGAKFARNIGISAGSDVLVRSREVISGNCLPTRGTEEVYGREVTRPHEIDETAGQDYSDDYLETFPEYEADES